MSNCFCALFTGGLCINGNFVPCAALGCAFYGIDNCLQAQGCGSTHHYAAVLLSFPKNGWLNVLTAASNSHLYELLYFFAR